jgi:hypothetical protein
LFVYCWEVLAAIVKPSYENNPKKSLNIPKGWSEDVNQGQTMQWLKEEEQKDKTMIY